MSVSDTEYIKAADSAIMVAGSSFIEARNSDIDYDQWRSYDLAVKGQNPDKFRRNLGMLC